MLYRVTLTLEEKSKIQAACMLASEKLKKSPDPYKNVTAKHYDDIRKKLEDLKELQ